MPNDLAGLREVSTVAELRELRQQWGGASVGFVPTMGYLHEGHATLIRQASCENDHVVVSVFVNPTQFGPKEDLSRYPRDLPADRQLIARCGGHLLFAPDITEMYPAGFGTRVVVEGVSAPLEGAARPTHFEGVATVVLKLLQMAQPTRAYFGEKDWQQLAVVRRMVNDLNVPTQVVGVPTQREDSGLALSSRNSYLTPEQRSRAAILSRALRAVQQAYSQGERQVGALLQAGQAILQQEPELSLDYLQLVGPDMVPLEPQLVLNTQKAEVESAQHIRPNVIQHSYGENMFTQPKELQAKELGSAEASVLPQYQSPTDQLRLVVAARLFGARLIDNMPLLSHPTDLTHSKDAYKPPAGGTA